MKVFKIRLAVRFLQYFFHSYPLLYLTSSLHLLTSFISTVDINLKPSFCNSANLTALSVIISCPLALRSMYHILFPLPHDVEFTTRLTFVCLNYFNPITVYSFFCGFFDVYFHGVTSRYSSNIDLILLSFLFFRLAVFNCVLNFAFSSSNSFTSLGLSTLFSNVSILFLAL